MPLGMWPIWKIKKEMGNNIKMHLIEIDCEVGRTSSILCPIVDFHIKSTVPFGSITITLIRFITNQIPILEKVTVRLASLENPRNLCV
jgi:hypothetical protein